MASRTKTTATSVKTLTKALYEDLNDLRMGLIKEKLAKEVANIAGKILNAYKVRLEYKQMTRHDKPIEGIEDEVK